MTQLAPNLVLAWAHYIMVNQMVKDQEKWTKLYDAYAQLDMDTREQVARFYLRLQKEQEKYAEEAMERALAFFGFVPQKFCTEEACQEYDDIQHGEEIWASIQRSSGN